MTAEPDASTPVCGPGPCPVSVSQSSSSWEAPAPSHRTNRSLRWAAGDLGDRVGEHLDVVGGGVRPGLPGAQHRGQELLRVVAPDAERVEPEGPLERGRRLLLLAVRDHDRGVHVEHDRLTEVGPGDLRGREPPAGSQLRPHMTPDPGPRGRDLLHRAWRDLVQGPPHRRRRGDRPSTGAWWRSTSMSAIASPPSAIITATSTSTRPRSWTGTNERRAIALDNSAVRPSGRPAGAARRCPRGPPRRHHHRILTDLPTTKYASPTECLPVGELGPSQAQVSPAGQALRCFYAPITPPPRERKKTRPSRKARPESHVSPGHVARQAPGAVQEEAVCSPAVGLRPARQVSSKRRPGTCAL